MPNVDEALHSESWLLSRSVIALLSRYVIHLRWEDTGVTARLDDVLDQQQVNSRGAARAFSLGMVSINAKVALIHVELAQPQLLISPTYPGGLIGRLADLSWSRRRVMLVLQSYDQWVLPANLRCLCSHGPQDVSSPSKTQLHTKVLRIW